MEEQIEIKMAQEADDFLEAKKMIFEYVEWLGIDLTFQNFNNEMDSLPETYGSPNGGLFLALRDKKTVGVAGIKRFSENECEVKRMFVQPGSRGLGIGKMLLTHCIDIAKKLAYEVIKLDTADFMKPAIKLYADNGFVEISAYRYNPHEHARYFELSLKKA